MRITPHEPASPALKSKRRLQWAAASIFLLVFVLILRRGLLVIFLGLKILGHSGPLDTWKGEVRRETVQHSGIPIDIYSGESSYSPLLIIHGVNPTGKDSPDLMRISGALAQSGYQVFVPDLAEMKRQHLDPEEAARIKSVFEFIGKDAAIACFSYGCGPAMIAAADSDIRNRVRFALAFGGYFDVRETLVSVITNPKSDIVYWKWVFLGANADLVAGESDRSTLQVIAERRAAGKPDAGETNKLSAEAKVLVDLFNAPDPEMLLTRLRAGPENLQHRLDALSPSRVIGQIRAPLILVHGINDAVIPAQQTIAFAKAAGEHGLDYRLTLLETYGHMTPALPKIGFKSFFSFYVPETLRFFGVVNRLVAAM
jgi:pimeloyl-ACP methyl ester carboxylesterase